MQNPFYILLILFLLFSSKLTAASSFNFYALIVGDTHSDIGKSVKIDLENIGVLVDSIGKSRKINLTKMEFVGKNFSYYKLKQTLDNLPQQDIIFFYYAGHGRNDGVSQWPTLDFARERKNLDFVEIFSLLKTKKNKLLIAVADACNNYSSKFKNQSRSLLYRSTPSIANYEKIFLGYEGEFIAASASNGEYAYGEPDKGGLFTQQFLVSIRQELMAESPSWDNIVEKSKKTIFFTDSFSNSYKQTPQFKGELNSIGNDSLPDTSPPIGNGLSIVLSPSSSLSVGDNLQINVTNNTFTSGYLNLWDIDSHGNISCIYPVIFSEQRLVSPRETIKTPSGAGFLVGEPHGENIIVAAITNEKSYPYCINIVNNITKNNKNKKILTIYNKLKKKLNSTFFTYINYYVTP